jgi:GTP pyrophosphokinase
MADILEQIKENARRFDPASDVAALDRAYGFVIEHCTREMIPDGRLLLDHSLETALILSNLNMEAATLSAAILMCVDPDSGGETGALLESKVGKNMADLTRFLARMRVLHFSTEKRDQAIQMRELMLALQSDVRLLLIKLASRLDLMRHINDAPPDGRENFAQETLDIITPLAHRLGLSQIKSELEDLCFAVLDPSEFERLRILASDSARKREEAVGGIIRQLKDIFKEHGLKVHITGRTKRLFSMYQKMMRLGKDFHELYDLAAVRIITNTVAECYQALAILHTQWTPVLEEFDNYIAAPKPNGYQSIHTVVNAPGGSPVEIQIRTWEMHARAEYGVAAHFSYKETMSELAGGGRATGDAMDWVRQVADETRRTAPDEKALDSILLEAQEDRVFTLTPKGKVIPLPTGATPIDFAYRIHSDVGRRCRGVKINGRIAPIGQKLRNGDVVEIMTQKGGTPSRDWLRFAVTPAARNKIRAWFKKADRDENIVHGRAMLQREITRVGLKRKDLLERIDTAEILRAFNFKAEDDLHAAIGCGDVSIEAVTERFRRSYRELIAAEEASGAASGARATRRRRGKQDVIVEGFSDVMVSFPKCCYPAPGDEIVGFVTHGRGLAIHRKECPNIRPYVDEGRRIVQVSWDESTQEIYYTEIEMQTIDRVGVLQEILAIISEAKINIAEVKSKVLKNSYAATTIRLEVTDAEMLNKVIPKIKRIDDVISIRRKL